MEVLGVLGVSFCIGCAAGVLCWSKFPALLSGLIIWSITSILLTISILELSSLSSREHKLLNGRYYRVELINTKDDAILFSAHPGSRKVAYDYERFPATGSRAAVLLICPEGLAWLWMANYM